MDMDAIGKELEANRAILDQEQWAQKVLRYMRGPPKPEPMSGAAPILLQLKQWRGNKCVRHGEHGTLQGCDGEHAEKNSKRVDIAALSALEPCWTMCRQFYASLGMTLHRHASLHARW